MTKAIRIVTEPGDRLMFNWSDEGGPTTVVAARLHRCSEIECSPRGLFFTYPEGPATIAHAKADLDVVNDFILSDVPVILMLDREDDDMWLFVALPSTSLLDEFVKRRAERLIHHLSEGIQKRS